MSESELVAFRTVILGLVPRWLRAGSIGPRGIAGKFLYAIGAHVDAFADGLVQGVQRRWPGFKGQFDSLPAIGADRRIPRGPIETDEGYAARLVPWLDAHQTRGGPYAMLGQLWGYWAGTFGISLVYRSGARFSLAAHGVVVRDTLAGWIDTGPVSWTLFFEWFPALSNDGLWGSSGLWGDGGLWGSSLTPTEVANITLVPTGWNSAEALGHVVLLPPATYADTSHWQDSGLVSIPIY